MTLEQARHSATARGYHSVLNFLGNASPLANLTERFPGEWSIQYHTIGAREFAVLQERYDRPIGAHLWESYTLLP